MLKRSRYSAIPDQVLQKSTDRHYEIDNMVLSNINQPGTYTVDVVGEKQAQAYALVAVAIALGSGATFCRFHRLYRSSAENSGETCQPKRCSGPKATRQR